MVTSKEENYDEIKALIIRKMYKYVDVALFKYSFRSKYQGYLKELVYWKGAKNFLYENTRGFTDFCPEVVPYSIVIFFKKKKIKRRVLIIIS